MEALIERIAFLIFAVASIAGAIGVVMNRNPITSAMCLVMTFLSVAGLYLTLGATFLMAVQILVYAGAIMVLFLFVIMLLNLEQDPLEIAGISRALAGVVGAAFLIAVITGFTSFRKVTGESLTDGGAKAVGVVFANDYVFPFEAASILLLVAMIGAVIVARRKHGGQS